MTSSSDLERKIAFKAFTSALDKNDNSGTNIQPDICPICKIFFKDPVITKFGHKFCNSCAIQCFRADRTFTVCGFDTHGLI